MHANVTTLAARYAGRPVLMERGALEAYAQRLRSIDAHAFERPSRLTALMRKIGTAAGRPLAMEDEDYPPPAPIEERLVYAPRYIGEPDDQGYCWTLKDGIALLAVTTPIMEEGEDYCGTVYHGYDTLLAAMREAAADVRVKAIFLKANSPGGFAAGGILTLSEWMRANRAAAGGKPIWCYATKACSAMYWIAAQCDRIGASPMAYVGSIGAYTVHEDLQGMYDKAGIVITEFKAFAQKTDGASWKDLSPEARADIQSDIEQTVRLFVKDVAAGRARLTPAAIEALQSRVFTGAHDDPARSGLALGLVDELTDEEAFYASLLATVSGTAENPNPVSGAGARATQEQTMATAAPKLTAAQLAARAEEKKRLATALSAIEAQEKAETPTDPEDGSEAPETPGEKKDPEDDNEAPEAQKIAASAEAKEHPHLAMAAIQSKQSLVQFQATVKAQANAPKGGVLGRLLAETPRLGPDGQAEPAKAATIDTAAIYDRRRSAARR